MIVYPSLRVRLVGGVEKWEDGKLVEGWKIERIENFFVWLERKMGGWKI